MTAFKCDLTGSLKTCLFMQRGALARDQRSEPQPTIRQAAASALALSQTTPSAVPNDGRECPKRRYSLSQTTPNASPECPKGRPSRARLRGAGAVPNDGTHIIYQSVVSSEVTPDRRQTTTANAATPAGSSPIAAPALPPNRSAPIECPTRRFGATDGRRHDSSQLRVAHEGRMQDQTPSVPRSYRRGRGHTGRQSDGRNRGVSLRSLCRGCRGIQRRHKGQQLAAYAVSAAAAYEFLMKPDAFAARVERKRAEIARRSRRTVDSPTSNAPTSSLIH